MALLEIEIVNGLLATLFVLISVYVGLRILLKFFEMKQRVFLFFGLTWILIVCPWYPFMISFFVALATDVALPLQTYVLLGNFLVPPGILVGVAAFTELLYHDSQKKLCIIFGILALLMEILIIYLVINDPSFIGYLNDRVDFEYSFFFQVYMLAMLAVIMVAGILFSLKSIKADDKMIKLKGKFLLTAFITFAIGTAMEATLPLGYVTLVITRLFLLLSVITFYGGFILPKWMSRLFGVEESTE
jgi:hypothetical protein